MTTTGAGVFEIKAADERSWYRVIYLSKVGDTIHVLHSLEKDTRLGGWVSRACQSIQTAGVEHVEPHSGIACAQ